MSVNHLNQVKTREEYKKIKEDERKKSVDAPTAQKASKAKTAQKVSKAAYEKKRIRIRLIPIWLRMVLLLVLTGVFMVAGTAVGYSFLGDGNAGDVLKQSTWTHILDLIEKK
ncbi:DNA-directed RNA polymerase subunit beta [Bacillus sp. OK048]|uniref:DNA-directed RNA polymerase subunit beta n=1 Tax=Bacillus sp. OK048 TaxID=1882761 RepID=UPI0008866FC4|nr:DNA-directed RNA polymerase subunit beta [Bacillus sp. OK048]SDN04020.1 DNA-directed RNA polymerase subunit beta [Bacillus sp. OK048]